MLARRIASVSENGTVTGFANISVVRTRAYNNADQNINNDVDQVIL